MEINLLSVLVAGIASMFVGFLWYALLFKKPWMELMGFTNESMGEMKMTANQAYILQFVASLVTAYVMAYVMSLSLNFFDISALEAGLTTAFWLWLGFVAPIALGSVLWEGKPWKLWLINASQWLVALGLMGVVLSFWL